MSDGSKNFDVVFGFLHTIDYRTVGVIPSVESGRNLSRTGPMRTNPGGVGNGAPVAAKLFGRGRVGCATLLCHDANGEEFHSFMQEVGVDTGGVKWTDPKSDRVYSTRGPSGRLEKVRERELGSGMSFVCLPPWTGDPLIFYSGGSNNVFGREHVDLDYISRAHLLVVDYSTLLPRLDENGGKPMAAVIRDVRARGVLTLLDTHSIPGADYSVLREPLRETDIFACNIHEARGVTGLGPDASMEEVLTSIANRMGVDGKRSRMIAITNKDKPAYLAYCPKGSRKLVIAKVDACKVKVVDGTGAGDGFKAGLAAYVVRNKAAFEAGTLSLTEAGRFANAVAASYISAKGTENVGDYLASAAAARRIYAGARVEETVVEATPRGRRLRV